MGSDEFNKLVLGALLHDIGKFKQRAGFPEDNGKNHSHIGYEWLSSHYGEGIISAAAQSHHGYEQETWKSNLSLIIYEADNLAASERKEFDPTADVAKNWHSEVSLASDFSRVRLEADGRKEVLDPPKYWPLERLGGWILPQEDESGGSKERYRDLWEKFQNDFEKLKNADRHLDIELMLHLLERYTSFIPSITLHITGATDRESFRKHPDVSLFDHSKITAAVSGCLYRFYSSVHKERWERKELLKEEITGGWDSDGQEPFLLVGGDLSGVQKFIYTISSRGALKALKGRSFFLELLVEHIVDCLVERLSLTRCNVLFTGGGHFYLLAPNTEETRQVIEGIRTDTNDYLWNSFNGELSCCIAFVTMGKRAFKDATVQWAELVERLDSMKRRKWDERLHDVLGPPAMPHHDCLTARCEVCAREDLRLHSVRDVLMCPSCREQFLFGEELQRVARENRRAGKGYVGIGVWDKLPKEEEGFLTIAAAARERFYKPVLLDGTSNRWEGQRWTYRLNDWNVGNYLLEGSRPLMAGIFHAGEFEDLESLVEKGYGWNRAAVLRMDVDRLGKIFSSGLPEGDRTFSRVASLSRHFSLFFKYHLNGVLDLNRKEGYEKTRPTRLASRVPKGLVSIVYSGGDDLFLIGHWLDVFEAAFDIQEAFASLTANPSITLSAGVVFAAPHHPIYRFARDAGEAEEMAKSFGRNSLTILGHTFTWKEAADMRRIIEEGILPLLRKGDQALEVPPGSVSKGFFYRIIELVRPFTRPHQALDQGDSFWLLPKVAYLTGRIGPSKEFIKTDQVGSAWSALKDRLLCQPKYEHLKKIEGAVMWALMMMRKGEK